MDRDKIIEFWSVFFNSILTFILCNFNLFSILILKWAVFTFCSINMSSPTIIFPRLLFSTRYKVKNSKNYIFRINLVVYLNKFILIEIPGIQTCYVHGDCGFYFQMCKCWWWYITKLLLFYIDIDDNVNCKYTYARSSLTFRQL